MIRIVQSGIHSTIQGNHRTGYLKYGVPGSGPSDSLSMRGANLLVGNGPWAPAIEMLIQGPQIYFEEEMQIAICGAFMNPKINHKSIPQNECITVGKGDSISFSPAVEGTTAYLSIGGGIKVAEYMGSTSTYLPGKFGGHHGSKLAAGDVMSVEKLKVIKEEVILPNFLKFIGHQKLQLRVLTGPEYETFSRQDLDIFFQSEFEISSQSSRIGVKMHGRKKLTLTKRDIISSSVLPGTIQVSSSGLPIIMMNDHQTTGGYARIANVITHDLDYLLQCTTGTKITFRQVSLKKAQELIKKRELRIEKLFDRKD